MLDPGIREVKFLRFTNGNSKIDKAVFIFSLPAGHFCPFAKLCLSKADRHTGRTTDGPHTQFRCYAAASENYRLGARKIRWDNYELLRKARTTQGMADLILASLTPLAGIVRIHESGDFFSQAYFDAWLEVARQRPWTRFYAYSKSLPYWVRRKDELPSNLVLTASYGGTHDHLIEEHGLRYSRVVLSQAEADELGLEIDHDDSHAMSDGASFALLIHGHQPAGSPAMRAVTALRAQGEYGYGKAADKIRARTLAAV